MDVKQRVRARQLSTRVFMARMIRLVVSLTFDMSGDRPAQPVGHPIDGMVRRPSSLIEHESQVIFARSQRIAKSRKKHPK